MLKRFSVLALFAAIGGWSHAADPAEKPAPSPKGELSASPKAPADFPANRLTFSEEKAGWKLLFNGENFEGWRNYQKENVSDGWKVEKGAMVRAEKGAGDLVTEQQFDNFELALEYRISPEGNSGLMFLVTEDNPVPWHSGPEVQIQDNKAGHDPQKAGWLYQLYESDNKRPSPNASGKENQSFDATNPAGEWNQLYLRVTQQQSAVVMNGYPYYQFVVGSDDWNKRVAKSKFSEFEKFAKAEKGHICLQDHGDRVSFRNIKIRQLSPSGEAPNPVDGTANVRPVPAFPKLEFNNWEPVSAEGKVQEIRPICITHAGDGSNRMFVGTQRGVVHTFKNSPDAATTKIFLDIEDQVASFKGPGANEEGLLGIAFHPNYEKNGRFFVYYTMKDPAHTSRVCEFTVSKDDSDQADLKSQKELMRIEQPFANHNGGSIEFGPDGYLYIALGDGGSAYDPMKNGQNPKTLLGSILRIDVDQKSVGKNYGIPEDNPFADGENGAPEVFAYGFRNPWRIGFDRKTGYLWAADVGQDLWEEVNIVEKGGNYGWNGREGLHPFGDRQTQHAKPISPVWEYDHQVGKSITGGFVYRGKSVPQLDGCYLYADYVTGKLWALKVNDRGTKAIKNWAIPAPTTAVLAYGEDEAGEVYFSVGSTNGQGLFKFEATGKTAGK